MESELWSAEEVESLRTQLKTKTHREIATTMGRTEKAVRGKCYVLGYTASRHWSAEEDSLLLEAYGAATNHDLDIAALSERIGRSRHAIFSRAHKLGIGARNRPGLPKNKRKKRRLFESDEALKAHQSARQKRFIEDHGHPRGMLGKKHSSATKERLRVTSTLKNARLTSDERAALAMKSMRTRVKNGTAHPHRVGVTWKSGWREIGGARKFYRSRWEANYARYLNWLLELGEIADWEHEPETFWFDGVRRGCVSYLPDFRVLENDGRVVYHEVKGWMDSRSKTKIRRMAKYHPAVRLIVVAEKQYKEIERKVSAIIAGWE